MAWDDFDDERDDPRESDFYDDFDDDWEEEADWYHYLHLAGGDANWAQHLRKLDADYPEEQFPRE